MNQITFSYTSSSYQNQHQQKTIKPSQLSYVNSLHSVRSKAIRKPTTKHFTAPMPPTPPKVYNIDSSFKEAVRMLTSTPEFQYPSARRLKDIAPPPLVLSTIPKPSLFPEQTPLEGGGIMSPLSDFIMSPDFCNLLNETLQTTRFTSTSNEVVCSQKPVDCDYHQPGGAIMSPLGVGLSPNTLSWCSSFLLSPETIS